MDLVDIVAAVYRQFFIFDDGRIPAAEELLMKVIRKKRRKPFVPISTMSDIAFLLLIFMMLISLIHYQEKSRFNIQKRNTYSTEGAKNWKSDRPGGRFYVGGKEQALQEIEGLIADTIVQDPSTQIQILADRDTPYRNINSLVEILKQLQHRVVSFVAREPQKDEYRNR